MTALSTPLPTQPTHGDLYWNDNYPQITEDDDRIRLRL